MGYGVDVKGYGVDVKGCSVDVKGYRSLHTTACQHLSTHLDDAVSGR